MARADHHASPATQTHRGPSGRCRIAQALVCVTALALTATATNAQAPAAVRWFERGTVMITVQGGGAAFTDFQRATARSTSTEPELREFQRRVSAHTTGTVGGWLAVWLSDVLGVRAGASYTPSSFEVSNEQSAQRVFDARTGGTEGHYARLDIVLIDGSVLFRFPPRFGRFVPYGLAGAGIVRYTTSGGGDLPPEARTRFASGTHSGLTGVIGLGAVVALQKRDLLLSFEFTDHFSRTPLDDPGDGESFELAGMPLQLQPEGHGTNSVGIMNTVRLLVGITLPIRM